MKPVTLLVVGIALFVVGVFVAPRFFLSHQLLSSLIFEVPGVICCIISIVWRACAVKSKAK
jgi:hypothetical membrane protein